MSWYGPSSVYQSAAGADESVEEFGMSIIQRQRALELLYYDASLASRPPDGKMPLGRAFHHQAKLVSSRSSWDPLSTTSVVYGKAGRESYHGHADWGVSRGSIRFCASAQQRGHHSG